MLEVSDSLILAQRQDVYPITKEIYAQATSGNSDSANIASALGVYGMAPGRNACDRLGADGQKTRRDLPCVKQLGGVRRRALGVVAGRTSQFLTPYVLRFVRKTMTAIRIESVSKNYGPGSAAVQDVTLRVESGEFFFLLGPSGCGKTTLLRIVAGLLESTSGRVFFGDRDVTALPPQQRRAAMVFQNYALWPHMTVQENVEFAPRMEGKPRPGAARLPPSASSESKWRPWPCASPPSSPAASSSGSHWQGPWLPRATSCFWTSRSRTSTPGSAPTCAELRELVKSAGRTALYVTHDQAEALSMADRVAVLDAGRVAQVGTPQDLYERPASRFVADFLGEANFLDGDAGPAAGVTAIRTAAGNLLAAQGGLAGPVTCCVRPENVRIQVASPKALPEIPILRDRDLKRLPRPDAAMLLPPRRRDAMEGFTIGRRR